MFFQVIIYILTLVGFAFLAWRLIVKPILESAGVEVDEEEVITTTHTNRLKKTKREYEEALLSVNAVNEEKHLKRELKDINEKIKNAEMHIEDTEK